MCVCICAFVLVHIVKVCHGQVLGCVYSLYVKVSVCI